MIMDFKDIPSHIFKNCWLKLASYFGESEKYDNLELMDSLLQETLEEDNELEENISDEGGRSLKLQFIRGYRLGYIMGTSLYNKRGIEKDIPKAFLNGFKEDDINND
jgi:hypothetical protein